MNTSSRNRTQFADFQLIQDEILKFAGMKASELMSYFKEHPADALYSIPHPAGGTVFIGKKGGQAFSRISVTYLESLSSSGLEFESHAFTDELKKLYLEWIVSGKTLDPTTLCQLLDDAAARRRSAHISLQHCIPCSVVFAEIPPEFEVGPVKFRRMLDFLSEHLSLIKNRAGAVRHSTGQAPQRERSKRSQADFLVQELEQFFPTFKWIASIVIPACDSSVSKERAHRAVQSSLDLLKLFLSGMRTSGIRQAHRSRHSPNIVELTRDERGQFHIGWRRGPEDAVVDNNWHAMITSYYNWTAATKILESSIASVETRKLYQRFLDALTWYGDGISEETYAGKLVKFVAALERITGHFW